MAPRALPAAVAAVAAALKVSKATRNGARVTVAGTISSRAKGKVTIAYAQKVGHATVTMKKTVTVAKGRWSTTLTLPRSLTRGSAARGKGPVTVTCAGTAAVKRATAKHAVSIARAKRATKSDVGEEQGPGAQAPRLIARLRADGRRTAAAVSAAGG
ncbi:MAG TPA: hypothetical protein VK501_13805 [Baekduia sp.]|uniref:hypothetical protein n=1 Tax=Baekduia sp. TaxID=2600305 RepID=UPI002C57C7D6|nr:hypothetical protein [Baekduia sp.]HMJ34982.1 hypothetical protein [Baekduia sp.]